MRLQPGIHVAADGGHNVHEIEVSDAGKVVSMRVLEKTDTIIAAIAAGSRAVAAHRHRGTLSKLHTDGAKVVAWARTDLESDA